MNEGRIIKAENTKEKKEEWFDIEVIRGFDGNVLEGILEIENECFPVDWGYDDAESYYKDALENPENINIVLRKDKKIAGYLLAVFYDELLADEEFMEADPDFKGDSERYYIETIGIIPEYRQNADGNKMYFNMLKKLLEEAMSRNGIHKFSLHARVNSGFSLNLQKSLGRIVTKVRRIDKWKYYNDEEPTDYLELEYEQRNPKNL
jgi:ribosomal protein S18 acetylase RimI-like enzyme